MYMVKSSEQDKCYPQVVATISTHGIHTPVQISSDDGHQASTKAVHVVRVVSTADSRTERLRKPLTASNSRAVSLVRTLSSRR